MRLAMGVRGVVGVLLCCLAATGTALAAADVGRQGAPRMDFTPLPAGSYRLPPIQPVGDAELLDERGRAVHLSTLTAGKISIPVAIR